MKFIDLHCDTAGKIYYDNYNLNKNQASIDVDKLKKGDSMAQVFAMFVDQKLNLSPYDEFKKIYDKFILEVKNNKNDIEVVRNINELQKVNSRNKIGALLSVEEGEVIEGNIDNLVQLYNLGIRIFTITWNYKNQLGYPNYNFKFSDKGLTSRGIESVMKCEELGIIPDASHLSDKGFYDLVNICNKPFIASHSNSRFVTNNPRNLTDDMIKKLAEKGGVMGLNFCADFLGDDKTATINAIINHAKHIKKVGGIEVISLGSDFDGILNNVEILDASEFYKLHDAFLKNNFTESEIEKIFYKNIIRVFNDTLN